MQPGDALVPVIAAMRKRAGIEIVELGSGGPFAGLDAVVATEAPRKPCGVPLIGLGCADAGFDHMLVASTAIRDRLVGDGLSPDRISVVGDPRLDPAPDVPYPFANGRQTVLYSPIASPRRSSWYIYGRAVLEHFLRDGRRNLILAPAPRLFMRGWHLDGLSVARPGMIERRFFDAPNIHIDLTSGGARWAAVADICLGDAGKAVDAFLREPRPCLFLGHRHGAAAHWLAGEVIADADALNETLDRAVDTHVRYRSFQEVLFARRADITAEPAAERAARAILSILAPAAPLPLFGTRAARVIAA